MDKPVNFIAWGRTGADSGRSWLRHLVATSPLILAPLAIIINFITLTSFEGSYASFAAATVREGFWTLCVKYGPELTFKGVFAVTAFIAWQAWLFAYLPGEIRTGQFTPAGHRLQYCLNGLSAWALTHVAYFTLCLTGVLDPAFIPRNWSSLIAALNLAGLVISVVVFIKAHVCPTHADDRKFSGFAFYDFYMGIELNPRLGGNFDLKLFSNGRPGMILWTLT